MQIMKLSRARIDHPALLCVTQTIFTIFKFKLNVCHLPWAGFFTTLKGDKALTYRAALGTALDPAASAFAVASAVVASCPSARLGVVAVAVEVAVSV